MGCPNYNPPSIKYTDPFNKNDLDSFWLLDPLIIKIPDGVSKEAFMKIVDDVFGVEYKENLDKITYQDE